MPRLYTDGANFGKYASLAGLSYEGYVANDKKRELKEKANAPALRVLLMSLYSMLRDGAENTYYKGAETLADNRGQHKQNLPLDAIYDCLCALGYQMSDEETTLRDGTHEMLINGGEKG